MVRDITGLRIDKNPNNVSSKSNGIDHMTVRVTPRIAAERVEETNSNADDGNGLEKQDVLGALLSSSATEKEHSGATTAGNNKIVSPLASRNTVRSDRNRYHDEEDNLSLVSSVAASVRSTISRITVPVAPKFVCNDRLSRRKEFYSMLEEKHRALEAEKVEVAARTKEEEETAIKQLRKTAVYKANPVPSFYREGPPPKVELKKLPVTRAKSPNLSRRKSCSDAVKISSPDQKGNNNNNNNCDRIKRHSIGTHKNPMFSRHSNSTTLKTKDNATMGSRNSSSRSSKEGIFTPTPLKSKSSMGRKKVAKEVEEMSLKVADMSMANCVEETVTSPPPLPTAIKDEVRTETDTNIHIVEDDKAIEPKEVEHNTADIAVET